MVEFNDIDKVKPLFELIDIPILSANVEKIFPNAQAAQFKELCVAITPQAKHKLLMSRDHIMSTQLYNAYNAMITNDTVHIATRAIVALHFFSIVKGKIVNVTRQEHEANLLNKRFKQLELELSESIIKSNKLNEEKLVLVHKYETQLTLSNTTLASLREEKQLYSTEITTLTSRINELTTSLSMMKATSISSFDKMTVQKTYTTLSDLRNLTKGLRVCVQNLQEEVKLLKGKHNAVKEIKRTVLNIGNKMQSFKKATKLTYFQGLFKNTKINTQQVEDVLEVDEVTLLKEYDETLCDYEHDAAFLSVYAKIAQLTSFKCALKYRAMVACKYWSINNISSLKNLSAKFYITYIDPFNRRGQTSFVQFMRMKSTKRRRLYSHFYRQFDCETGNSISIHMQDKQEHQYLEEFFLQRCNRLDNEDKNMISYDTSYYPPTN